MSTISASTTSTTAYKVTADTTGTLVFQTGASPTTAMTLGSDQSVTFAGTPTYSGGTANGVAYLNGSKVFTTGTALVFDGANLGVGVTSPSAIIHAKGSANYTSIIVDNASTTGGGNFVARQNGSNKAYFGVSGSIEGNTSSDAGLFAETGGNIRFYTNGSATEKARITSGGRFLIGTTTSTYPLYVNLASDTGDFFARFQNTNASSPYGLYMQYSAAAPNNSVNEFIYCGDSSALRMSVRSNGGIANYTANNSPLSDRRLKKDIKPAGSYLEKICAIPVVTYLYNDQTDDLPNLGVIAQDVQAAAPELCNEEGWGTKAEDGTNYLGIWETDIQYALMKCIQEQQAIIETLTNRIQALENK